MGADRFAGFSQNLFDFLGHLAVNNNREWFAEHRDLYRETLLVPVKAFVAEFGPIVHMLNQELESEPKVGRTISRINNDIRFHRNRPLYRPFLYASFPRRGAKGAGEPLLYVGLYAHGASVGFYPGRYRRRGPVPLQEGVEANPRLFQKYLEERRIADRYSELTDGEEGAVTKFALPKKARRWAEAESFTVGDYFPATEVVAQGRTFLDRAREIVLDLYPLWLFALSERVREDYELYRENAVLLSSPLTKAAD